MIPNLILDMTSLLVPFCAVCLGFALVGLGALAALTIRERPRKHAFRTVDLGVSTPANSTHPAVEHRVAA
jgi:hypothetical protein